MNSLVVFFFPSHMRRCLETCPPINLPVLCPVWSSLPAGMQNVPQMLSPPRNQQEARRGSNSLSPQQLQRSSKQPAIRRSKQARISNRKTDKGAGQLPLRQCLGPAKRDASEPHQLLHIECRASGNVAGLVMKTTRNRLVRPALALKMQRRVQRRHEPSHQGAFAGVVFFSGGGRCHYVHHE